MSHHLIRRWRGADGQLFIDDLYVFPGDASTVLVMDVNSDVNGLPRRAGVPPRGPVRVQGSLRRRRLRGADLPGVVRRRRRRRAAGSRAARPHRGGRPRGRRARRPGAAAAGPARRPPAAASGCGRGRSATRSTSTCRCSPIVNGAVAKGAAPDLAAWNPGNAQNSFAGTTVRIDRARGPARPPAAAAGREDRRVVRDQARHRRRRLAAGQPGRVPDDVADLLAGRHPVHQPGQHPAPVAGPRPTTASHLAGQSPPSSPRRAPPATRRATARPWPRNCCPTCCRTWSAPPPRSASPSSNGRTLADNAPEVDAVAGRRAPRCARD